MYAVERQKKIIEELSLKGSISVNELSTDLGVTVETIRRDLEKLEKLEQLTRTHGGAVSFEGTTLDLPSEKRSEMNINGKIEIAKKAIQHIHSGDTIFLDGSTTSYYLSKLIKEIKNISVITNSLQIIKELSGCSTIKLISIGGVYDLSNESFIGEMAVSNIKNYCANKAFFSSKGVTTDKGILESNELEYQIKKVMLENSTKKYFLVDKSKINRIGFLKLADFSEIDVFVTDAKLSEEWQDIFDDNDIELI